MVEKLNQEEILPPETCPFCGSDLGQPGRVIVWFDLPKRGVGHLIPGEGDEMEVILDQVDENPPITIQCADCGELIKAGIEDYYLGSECVVGSPED